MKKILKIFIFIFLIGFVSAAVIVSLNSPADTDTTYVNPTLFNCSGSITGGNYLGNISLLTNESGTWEIKNTSTQSGKTYETTNYTSNHGHTLASSNIGTTSHGIRFLVGANNIYLEGMLNYTGANGTRALLKYDNGTSIQNASWNADGYFKFLSPIALQNATYYRIEMDAAGGSYTFKYEVTPSWPISMNALSLIGQSDEAVGETGGDLMVWSGFILRNETNATSGDGLFYRTINEDIIKWGCQACDNTGVCGYSATNYTLLKDSSIPSVTINGGNSIENYGIISTNHTINFTASDVNLGSCWLQYNGTNTTIPCVNSTLSTINFTMQQGLMNATVWVNDTVGNINATSITWKYKFFENSQSYSSPVYEGSSSLFLLNASIYNSTYQVSSAYLVYNGTSYSASFSINGYYSITKTLQIPSVDAETNKTFYWNITLADSTNIITTSYNQTVLKLNIDNCSSYSNLLMNLTLKDEETQSIINGTTDNSTIEIDLSLKSLDNSISIINYSHLYNMTNPAAVCLNSSIGNSSLRLDAVIRYVSDGRSDEFYNLQNFTLKNTTMAQNISLFDLDSSSATKFLITFKDENFLPVSDALIEITRKYISEGTFKTVEIPKTDSYGQAVGQFDLTGAIYTINVYKEGELLGVFDNVAVICENEVINDCKLNLNILSSSSEFSDYSEAGGITYLQDWNPDTRTLIITFTTLNGGTQTVNVTVYVFKFDGSETLACSDTLTSSAGTLSCVIPESFGNATFVAELYSDGELITTNTYSISMNPESYFGGHLYIMVLILFLTIPLMFITSTIGILIGIILGLVMCAGLLIFTNVSFLGITSSIVWGLIAIGIVIYKISRRSG